MIVYHGSAEIVKKPDDRHSYRALDFGRGFYVTTVREQAERWARRKANILGIKNVPLKKLKSIPLMTRYRLFGRKR